MDQIVKDYLLKIGTSSDTIAELAKKDRTEDDAIDLDGLAKTYNTKKIELLKNDADFISPLKKEIRGKELATAENKLKRVFGLTTDEMEGKNYEDILAIAKAKTGAGAAEGTEELQAQLLASNNRLKQLEEDELPAAKTAAEKQIRQYLTNAKVDALVAGHNLTVEARAILPAVRAQLAAGYNLELDESDNLVVKTKDGLTPTNADKTKTLTVADLVKSQLDDLKVIKQSNGDEGAPAGGRKIADAGTTGAPKFTPPGLKAAQANAADMGNIGKR